MRRNPFQPPGDNSALGGKRSRPRAAAVRASRRLVAGNGGRIPDDRSLCLRVGNIDRRALRRHDNWHAVRIMLGGGGLGAAAVSAWLAGLWFSGSPEVPWRVILGCTFGVGGGLLLLVTVLLRRRFVRRQLGERYGELPAAPGASKPLWISVESFDSRARPRYDLDNLGYMIVVPSRRTVVVETVLFRYMIHARDVLCVEPADCSPRTAVMITYWVDEVELRIVFHRSMERGYDAWLNQLRETLMFRPPPNPVGDAE